MLQWLKHLFGGKPEPLRDTPQVGYNPFDYDSPVPQVAIIGDGIDSSRGIRIELDWNPAFVQYLRASGFDGPDEETIVQKWLALTYHNLEQRIKPGVNYSE